MPHDLFSRRDFLAGTAAFAAASLDLGAVASAARGAEPQKPLRVAAINSVYYFKSHAYHIEGRILDGYSREGVHHQPQLKLARIFNDQYPDNDLSRELCRTRGIELSKTIAEALGGPGKLDVDAVLLICEHGDYPQNELGQLLYPRYEMFEQIVDVFRKSGRSVPVFIDKHLSFDHRLAAKMVAASRELKFPLMAGSSLPVTWRRPELEPALETPFREGLSIFGFDPKRVEIYLFHALEALQCMWERRRGGETGIAKVRCFQGPEVWKAGDEGVWSWKLLEAALARCPSRNVGPVKENVKDPSALVIDYRDGTRATVLNLMEQVSDLAFAATVAGQADPLSTWFVLPAPPGAKFFDPLTWNIERFFATGKPPYPIERTLLTSTALDLGLQSLHAGGKTIESAALDIRYAPPADSGFFRGRYTDA
ncbi:MAG: hypothetical protein K8U03_02255 [Planctomycetia bacterium]|nr:hypothetical protein [Planctomycetia bacterium]